MHLPLLNLKARFNFLFLSILHSHSFREGECQVQGNYWAGFKPAVFFFILQNCLRSSEVLAFIFFYPRRSKWKRLRAAWGLFQEQCCEHTFVLLWSEVSPPPTLWGGSCDVSIGWEKNQYAWQSGVVPIGPWRKNMLCAISVSQMRVATNNQGMSVLKWVLTEGVMVVTAERDIPTSLCLSFFICFKNSYLSFYPYHIIFCRYVWVFSKQVISGREKLSYWLK